MNGSTLSISRFVAAGELADKQAMLANVARRAAIPGVVRMVILPVVYPQLRTAALGRARLL